jgi:hypothetical protein
VRLGNRDVGGTVKEFEVKEWVGACALGAVVLAMCLFALMGEAHGSEPSTTLRALQSMPRHSSDADESAEARAERLGYLAGAIDGVARDRLERAVLVTLTRLEGVSAARFVDLDLRWCREGVAGWCDGGRAFGVMQLHGMKRTETRAEQMRKALALWRYHRQRCGSVAGAFAGYGSGNSCAVTKQAEERAQAAERLAGKL